MTAARWQRLVDDLAGPAADAGVCARLDEKPYTESVGGGRVRHDTSRSVFIRTDAGAIEISDKWWRRNPEVWIGWEVCAVDRDGIIRRTWPPTKKRSEVVAAVRSALEVAHR